MAFGLLDPSRAPDRTRALARYRALAASYDASCRRILSIRAAAIGSLRLAGGETVFDVACGTGATLLPLAERVGAAGRVIGIEQSPEMAQIARQRVEQARPAAAVSVLVAAVEEAPFAVHADALLLCYTHDVLQNPRAVQHLMRHARPGARVALAGMCFLPWWWGAPLNLFTGFRARHYLTTLRGLREPWKPLQAYCSDLKPVQRFHAGTSYLAIGTVDSAR
jgi:ubiquinone/menaquinone biosynthesis C-methylase UbiE